MQPSGPITRIVCRPFALDHDLVDLIGCRPRTRTPDLRCVIGALRKFQQPTHHNNREPVPMPVDEGNRHLRGGSAARTKNWLPPSKFLLFVADRPPPPPQRLDHSNLLSSRSRNQTPIDARLDHPTPARFWCRNSQRPGNISHRPAPIQHFLNGSPPQLRCVF